MIDERPLLAEPERRINAQARARKQLERILACPYLAAEGRHVPGNRVRVMMRASFQTQLEGELDNGLWLVRRCMRCPVWLPHERIQTN